VVSGNRQFELVARFVQIEGYGRLSLIRASLVTDAVLDVGAEAGIPRLGRQAPQDEGM
jgi:hypothetical protein